MNNYAVYGPNNILNNSLKNNARNLVKNTVNNNFFRSAYNKSRRQYFVQNGNGALVGFALISKNRGTDMKLYLIGTRQGKGIGRLLVEQIIHNAKQRGLKTITLESVPEARGFYNKLGFVPYYGNYMRYYISRRKSPSRRSRARSAAS